MTTLFDLAYRTAGKLGNLREGKATGGSTTTIIDNSARRTEDNDYFNGGTAFIIKTTNGLAPQGEFSVVHDYNNTSKTISVVDAFSAIVETGDLYAVNNSRFPLWLLVQKINDAVFHMGQIPVVDTTSLVTLTDTRKYDLPAAASLDLRDVKLLVDTREIPVLNWYVEHTAGGSAEKLVLTYDLPVGYYFKLTYAVQHPELRAATDVLNEVVHPDCVVYAAAASCLQWYMDKTRLKDFQATHDDYAARAERARAEYPLPPLPSRPRRVLLVNPERLSSPTAYDQE